MLTVPTSATVAILAVAPQAVAMAYARCARRLHEHNLTPASWFSRAAIFMIATTGRADRALRSAKGNGGIRVDPAGRR